MFLSSLFSSDFLTIIVLTLTPGLELRASIPYLLFFSDVNPFIGLLVIFLVNVLLGLLVFYLLDSFVSFLLRFRSFSSLYERLVARPRRKLSSLIDRFGLPGLALFIAVPLPGSGVYTAALAAEYLGIDFSSFAKAVVVGVFLAGFFVALLSSLFLF